jgi:threonine/homoserine/homoserine lactone efflux protein
MYFNLIIKGLILGISVAAPVGPIGILCINRTLNKNFKSGFFSGLGAATADLVYALVSVFGLSLISNFLIEQKFIIQIIGVIFLIYTGIKTIKKKDRTLDFKTTLNKGLLKDYLSTLFLTFTNPFTLLIFIGIFATFGFSNEVSGQHSVFFFLLSIFVGSCTWWLFLSGLVNQFRKKISRNFLKKMDLVSGILILFFGALIFIGLIKEIFTGSLYL